MKKLFPILFLFFSCSSNSGKTKNTGLKKESISNKTINKKDISDPTNTLTRKTEILQLDYIVWGCACANWVTPTDFEKYQDDKLAEHCIFIEPANKDLEVPFYFAPARHRIKVEGQFYVKPDYPKGTIQTEEQLNKAKVFRYTKLEVSEKPIDHSPKDDTTLNLSYNAIACTCAQWSNTKFVNQPDKGDYIYLERANNKLTDADNLWQGDNLPLQIQVTGQYVDEVGFPTGFNPAKGNPEPARVFRYIKIKVLKNGQKKSTY